MSHQNNSQNANGNSHNPMQLVSAKAEQSLSPPSQSQMAPTKPHVPTPQIPQTSNEPSDTDDIQGNATADTPTETVSGDSDQTKREFNGRPYWMKVRKISNKERRRRQNEHLRRLLVPKNAVMVLNEMVPKDRISYNSKMETGQIRMHVPNFTAQLNVEDDVYIGHGESKMAARNAAAEVAFREIMIKKMNKLASPEGSTGTGEGGAEEEALPMIQLASYALHQLFVQWEQCGLKIPVLRPPPPAPEVAPASEPEGEPEPGDAAAPPPAKVKKAKTLPSNAATMHPCMLLTYMRPSVEYRDVAAQGDRPQSMVFTVALDVDGHTYFGKATNKREARKVAARAACLELFAVQVAPDAADNAPLF